MATQGCTREQVEAARPSEGCHFRSLLVIASKPSPDSRGEDISNTGAACMYREGQSFGGPSDRLGEPTGRVPVVALPVHVLFFLNI